MHVCLVSTLSWAFRASLTVTKMAVVEDVVVATWLVSWPQQQLELVGKTVTIQEMMVNPVHSPQGVGGGVAAGQKPCVHCSGWVQTAWTLPEQVHYG